ncbi:hypothetical protein GCM10017620_11240 [Brevundimonas intermedia]|uniref:Uncharacterized protein n=1 Tax=Brevundimonas intermedia TaxID=74315 RepID=A0ABQ5T6Z8_9CAUL|nr:hypothetical protein GCM10017620_11240 [Brevundimonas intermedia]
MGAVVVLATLKLILALGGTLQNNGMDGLHPVSWTLGAGQDVSTRFVGSYEMQPGPPQAQWEDGCRPRWTLSSNGLFDAEMGANVTRGQWRVEQVNGRELWLVLENLSDNAQRSCIGSILAGGSTRLYLVVIGDRFFIATPPRGSDGELKRVSPLLRFQLIYKP